MKKDRLIPFRMLPGSWGLTGSSYAEAEANYYYEGEELELKLIDIRFGSDPARHVRELLEFNRKHSKIDAYEYELGIAQLEGEVSEREMLDLNFRHGRIDEYEYDYELAVMDTDEGNERELALLGVNLAHERITKNEYDKAVAEINNEPWVGIIDNGFDPSQGVNGVYFEFDWNNHWVEYLRNSGYSGMTEQQVVEQWFADVCRSTADVHVEIDQPVPFNSSRVINRIRRDGGATEYS